MCISVFEISDLDEYQNTTSKVIPLHELLKSSASRAFHPQDTGFYGLSEKVLHERFIASDGMKHATAHCTALTKH